MDKLKRYSLGDHSAREIRVHLLLLATVFWVLVILGRLGYPAENNYSITRETLSALGSFESRYNPQWFWLFTVAMTYCGLLLVPVVFYIYRHFKGISRWGAAAGACFFQLGALGILLAGLFPYAHSSVIGNWEWKDFHLAGAALIIIGFVPGIFFYAALVIKDFMRDRTFAAYNKNPYRWIIGPFLFCIPVMGFVVYHVQWTSVYSALIMLIRNSRPEMVAHLSDALRQFARYPLLEHVAIWTLTLFIFWFAMALPCRYSSVRVEQDGDRNTRS